MKSQAFAFFVTTIECGVINYDILFLSETHLNKLKQEGKIVSYEKCPPSIPVEIIWKLFDGLPKSFP